MKAAQVWQFELTREEKYALNVVHEMSQKYMATPEYKDELPNGGQDIVHGLEHYTEMALRNCFVKD